MFTGAVALLAVNDHVLKDRAGGWWTGKLSDVVGVFIVAVLAGLLRRPRLATMGAALGFAALKLMPGVAELSAPLLGGVTRRDATDLIALLALVPAYRLTKHLAVQREPFAARPLLAAGSVVVATLSLTATSCLRPPAVDAFIVEDGHVLARITNDNALAGPEGLPSWAGSADGGHTWTSAEAPAATPSKQTTACFRDGSCFRTVAGERVEERRRDGPWRTTFAFTAEQRRRLNLRGSCGDAFGLGFGDLAVVDVAGRQHVVVAMGDQGALHRSPDGSWARRAVLGQEPLSIKGPSSLSSLRLVPLALCVLAPLLWFLGRRESALRRGNWAAAIAGGGSLLLLSLGGLSLVFEADYALVGPAIALAALGVFGISLATAIWAPPGPRPDQPERPEAVA